MESKDTSQTVAVCEIRPREEMVVIDVFERAKDGQKTLVAVIQTEFYNDPLGR